MPEANDLQDHQDVVRGVQGISASKLYSLFVSAINETSYLKIVESNEIKRQLRFVSQRIGDPQGLLELGVRPYLGENFFGSYFYISTHDEEFIKDVHEGKKSVAPHEKGNFVNVLLTFIETSCKITT